MLPPLKQVAEQLTVAEFDAGHWVYVEQHEQVNEEIEKWLRRVL